MKKKNGFLFTLFCIILIILTTLLIFNLFRIYNKTKNINLLSEYIIKDNEITNKNGLNKENSSYIFKGEINNNYILYNNLLWRIVKINNDSSITLILDDYINMLPKNLINVFFENLTTNLNTDYLTKNKICIDEMNDNEITCNKTNNDSYISLLSTYDYLNSFYEEKTFITKDKEIMWLYNNDNHTNGDSISKSNENNFYEIRPVITLKANTTYKDGNGKKDNPYKIDDEPFGLGSIIKINNDTYVVYDFINDIKLMSLKTIDNLNREKVLDYLNNELYENINYNNLLNNLTTPDTQQPPLAEGLLQFRDLLVGRLRGEYDRRRRQEVHRTAGRDHRGEHDRREPVAEFPVRQDVREPHEPLPQDPRDHADDAERIYPLGEDQPCDAPAPDDQYDHPGNHVLLGFQQQVLLLPRVRQNIPHVAQGDARKRALSGQKRRFPA